MSFVLLSKWSCAGEPASDLCLSWSCCWSACPVGASPPYSQAPCFPFWVFSKVLSGPLFSVWEASHPGLHTPLALWGVSLPTTPLSGLRLTSRSPWFLFPSGPSLLILLFFTIPSLISSAFFPGLGLDSFLPHFCCLFPFCFCSLSCLCANQPASQPLICSPTLGLLFLYLTLLFVLATSESYYEVLYSLEGSGIVGDTRVADG